MKKLLIGLVLLVGCGLHRAPEHVYPRYRNKYTLYSQQSWHYMSQATSARGNRNYELEAYFLEIKNRYDQCLYWLSRNQDCTVEPGA